VSDQCIDQPSCHVPVSNSAPPIRGFPLPHIGCGSFAHHFPALFWPVSGRACNFFCPPFPRCTPKPWWSSSAQYVDANPRDDLCFVLHFSVLPLFLRHHPENLQSPYSRAPSRNNSGVAMLSASRLLLPSTSTVRPSRGRSDYSYQTLSGPVGIFSTFSTAPIKRKKKNKTKESPLATIRFFFAALIRPSDTYKK